MKSNCKTLKIKIDSNPENEDQNKTNYFWQSFSDVRIQNTVVLIPNPVTN